MESIASIVTPLELVYPPFTNQEAEWLATDSDTVERWRRGSLYMITMRAEAAFQDVTPHASPAHASATIRGTLVSGDLADEFEIDLDDLLDYWLFGL